MKPIVYIIQDTGKNFLPAQKYGELRVIFTKQHRDVSYNEAMEHILTVLQNFSDNDYIVPTGDPLLIGLTVAAAFNACENHLQLLRWNATEYRYENHTIDA